MGSLSTALGVAAALAVAAALLWWVARRRRELGSPSDRTAFRTLHTANLAASPLRQGLNAGMIRQVLADANPALTTAMIGIGLNPRGWLEEVRICYGRDFMPRRCAAGRLGAPNSAPAKIWRGL